MTHIKEEKEEKLLAGPWFYEIDGKVKPLTLEMIDKFYEQLKEKK